MNNPPAKPPSTPPAIAQQVTLHEFKGPLPRPDILKGYNDVVPGAAERIIAMAEHEAQHLQTMEKMMLTSSYTERRLGQIFGLTIGIAGFMTCAWALYLGHPTAAAALGGSTLLGLVAVFVTGRLLRPSDRKKP